jgi:hypothetical protein
LTVRTILGRETRTDRTSRKRLLRLALTLVIGVLTAAAAIFATNHPRALEACVTSCE